MVISWSFDRPLHHVWQLEWETVVQTVSLLANSWTTLIASGYFGIYIPLKTSQKLKMSTVKANSSHDCSRQALESRALGKTNLSEVHMTLKPISHMPEE